MFWFSLFIWRLCVFVASEYGGLIPGVNAPLLEEIEYSFTMPFVERNNILKNSKVLVVEHVGSNQVYKTWRINIVQFLQINYQIDVLVYRNGTLDQYDRRYITEISGDRDDYKIYASKKMESLVKQRNEGFLIFDENKERFLLKNESLGTSDFKLADYDLIFALSPCALNSLRNSAFYPSPTTSYFRRKLIVNLEEDECYCLKHDLSSCSGSIFLGESINLLVHHPAFNLHARNYLSSHNLLFIFGYPLIPIGAVIKAKLPAKLGKPLKILLGNVNSYYYDLVNQYNLQYPNDNVIFVGIGNFSLEKNISSISFHNHHHYFDYLHEEVDLFITLEKESNSPWPMGGEAVIQGCVIFGPYLMKSNKDDEYRITSGVHEATPNQIPSVVEEIHNYVTISNRAIYFGRLSQAYAIGFFHPQTQLLPIMAYFDSIISNPCSEYPECRAGSSCQIRSGKPKCIDYCSENNGGCKLGDYCSTDLDQVVCIDPCNDPTKCICSMVLGHAVCKPYNSTLDPCKVSNGGCKYGTSCLYSSFGNITCVDPCEKKLRTCNRRNFIAVFSPNRVSWLFDSYDDMELLYGLIVTLFIIIVYYEYSKRRKLQIAKKKYSF